MNKFLLLISLLICGTLTAQQQQIGMILHTDTLYIKNYTLNDSIQLNKMARVWGQMTGLLSNQTDLQTALNLKGNITSQTFTTPVIGIATGTSLSVTGALNSTGTSGIGYSSGAGGTVSQNANKSTGVTLNKTTGAITMNNAALAAGAEVKFTVTNSTVAATDVPLVAIQSVGTSGSYLITVSAVAAGSFDITISNASAGSLSQAIVINFIILKGSAN